MRNHKTFIFDLNIDINNNMLSVMIQEAGMKCHNFTNIKTWYYFTHGNMNKIFIQFQFSVFIYCFRLQSTVEACHLLTIL